MYRKKNKNNKNNNKNNNSITNAGTNKNETINKLNTNVNNDLQVETKAKIKIKDLSNNDKKIQLIIQLSKGEFKLCQHAGKKCKNIEEGRCEYEKNRGYFCYEENDYNFNIYLHKKLVPTGNGKTKKLESFLTSSELYTFYKHKYNICPHVRDICPRVAKGSFYNDDDTNAYACYDKNNTYYHVKIENSDNNILIYPLDSDQIRIKHHERKMGLMMCENNNKYCENIANNRIKKKNGLYYCYNIDNKEIKVCCHFNLKINKNTDKVELDDAYKNIQIELIKIQKDKRICRNKNRICLNIQAGRYNIDQNGLYYCYGKDNIPCYHVDYVEKTDEKLKNILCKDNICLDDITHDYLFTNHKSRQLSLIILKKKYGYFKHNIFYWNDELITNDLYNLSELEMEVIKTDMDEKILMREKINKLNKEYSDKIWGNVPNMQNAKYLDKIYECSVKMNLLCY